MDVNKMSIDELKVYVAKLEAENYVYKQVIANSNFRPILSDRNSATRYPHTEEISKQRTTTKPTRTTSKPRNLKPVPSNDTTED